MWTTARAETRAPSGGTGSAFSTWMVSTRGRCIRTVSDLAEMRRHDQDSNAALFWSGLLPALMNWCRDVSGPCCTLSMLQWLGKEHCTRMKGAEEVFAVVWPQPALSSDRPHYFSFEH